MLERRRDGGFTLVEMSIGVGLLLMLSVTVLMVSSHFNRSFTKGEATAVAQQEAGLFLAALRNDMINCAPPPANPAVPWSSSIVADADRLRYHIHSDDRGGVTPVEWSRRGNTVSRIAGGKEKVYIKSDIASFSWMVGTDTLAGAAAASRQIWLEIAFRLQGGADRGALGAAPLEIRTKIFPRRLNHLINR